MAVVIMVIVLALILGYSPGLALIAAALAILVLDRYDPSILDRVAGRA